MEALSNIKRLINGIDVKLGAKVVDLDSGVKILCNGYNAAKGNTYSKISSSSKVESVKRIYEIFDNANKTTGYNDGTLTASVQRLCNNYAAGNLLYSFGSLYDIHIQYETGLADFQRALTYLKDKVPFTCICGDLVSYADSTTMAQYKNYVDTYAGNMEIYECAGNHETFPAQGVGGTLDTTLWKNTTGKDPYYSFEYGGDVFIFLSNYQHTPNNLFPSGGLAWLENTLEANKNKRCFVFQHIAQSSIDKAADPSNSYDAGMMEGTSGKAFIALLKRYKNTVWFHGHTHITLGVEQYPVSENLGYRSVHIPSLVSPRFYDKETNSWSDSYIEPGVGTIWGSVLAEGYIVEVYGSKIVLRGINFAAGANKNEVAPFTDEVYMLDTSKKA